MNWTEDQIEAFEFNRLAWDERVETHWQSEMYQRHVSELRTGRHCLDDEAIQHIGNLKNKSLIHLQCHMGMETLSWTRLGADAVGLDFSRPAIEKAKSLRDELSLDAQFICANVYDAVAQTRRAFDIVFVSVGAIVWLPDIRRWSQVVSELLRPGGRLYLDESHPFTDVFDDHPNEKTLEIKYPYLESPAMVFDEQGTYADLDAEFKHQKCVSYVHTIGSVVTSLIEAGLRIDQLEESARCMWPRFKMMQQSGPDDWTLPGPVLNKLPNRYTLIAHKPSRGGDA